MSVLIIGLPGLRKHVKLYVTQLLLKPNKSVQFNTTWALTHICVQRTFGNLQNNSLMNPGRIFTRTGPCNLFRDMKTQSVSRQKYTNKRILLWAPLKKPKSHSKNRREDLEKSLWDALSAFLCWGEIRNLLSAIWPLRVAARAANSRLQIIIAMLWHDEAKFGDHSQHKSGSSFIPKLIQVKNTFLKLSKMYMS